MRGLDMRLIRHYDTVGSRGPTIQHRSREEENGEESRGSWNGDAPALPFFPVFPICDVRSGRRRMPHNQYSCGQTGLASHTTGGEQ